MQDIKIMLIAEKYSPTNIELLIVVFLVYDVRLCRREKQNLNTSTEFWVSEFEVLNYDKSIRNFQVAAVGLRLCS